MPFAVIKPKETKLKKDRVPLQVQRSMVIILKNTHRRRAFTSAFQTGSITLEAALTIPVFLLSIVSILYFMVVINIHLNIQTAIEETADSLMTKMYVVNALSDKDNISAQKDIDNEIQKLIQNGITSVWLYKQTLDKIGEDNLNSTYIVNGAAGLNFIDSQFDIESGLGDIIVKYKVKIPFMPKTVGSMEFTQRCRFRFWTGISLRNEDETDVVYITTNGTVYHRDLTCHHLNLSISKTTYSDMLSLRNQSGAKYKACAYCVSGSLNSSSLVYITENGTKYHSRLGCSGLKRGIMTVNISDVGDMPPCSNCAAQ